MEHMGTLVYIASKFDTHHAHTVDKLWIIVCKETFNTFTYLRHMGSATGRAGGGHCPPP